MMENYILIHGFLFTILKNYSYNERHVGELATAHSSYLVVSVKALYSIAPQV